MLIKCKAFDVILKCTMSSHRIVHLQTYDTDNIIISVIDKFVDNQSTWHLIKKNNHRIRVILTNTHKLYVLIIYIYIYYTPYVNYRQST